jgi:ABC-type transport system substrate-binding protein
MVFERRGRGTGSGKRGFDKVRYLVVDDESTQWLMFLKGELDYLNRISRDNFDSIVGQDGRLDPFLEKQGVRIYSIPTMEVLHIGMNMKDPVLGPNRRLRQALNAAFDYPAWEKFYNGRILPCPTPVPPGVEGRLERPFPYAFDLEKAKRLIAEAGYPGGIDPKTGRRLALTMSIGRANQQSREQGELAAAFYERIGVKLEISYMTWDAFLKAVNEGRVQMFWMGWVGDYPDAETFLQLFYSKNVSPGPNHSYYVNAEYDLEYDAAMSASSAEERNRHWAACQEMIREDCPWIFSHFGKANSLVRPRVGNYVPSDFPYGQEAYFTVAE